MFCKMGYVPQCATVQEFSRVKAFLFKIKTVIQCSICAKMQPKFSRCFGSLKIVYSLGLLSNNFRNLSLSKLINHKHKKRCCIMKFKMNKVVICFTSHFFRSHFYVSLLEMPSKNHKQYFNTCQRMS